MLLALPAPVAAFFAADRTQDLDALPRCFADYALVRDEGRTIEGGKISSLEIR